MLCINLRNQKISIFVIYLNPTAACQTKAKSKNKTGITGKISTIGLKTANTSGNFARKSGVMPTNLLIQLQRTRFYRKNEYRNFLDTFLFI